MNLRKIMKKTKSVDDSDIVSPVDGEIYPVEEAADIMFSNQMLGQTICIRPRQGSLTIAAPANGNLEMLYPGGHAYAVRMKCGIGILIHIGIDTVELQGRCFKTLIKQGTGVYAGQPVVKVDFDAIRKAGYDASVMLIITENPDAKQLTFVQNQRVSAADCILL